MAVSTIADTIRAVDRKLDGLRDRMDRAREDAGLELKISIADLDMLIRLAAGAVDSLRHRGRSPDALADIELQVASERGRVAERELMLRARNKTAPDR